MNRTKIASALRLLADGLESDPPTPGNGTKDESVPRSWPASENTAATCVECDVAQEAVVSDLVRRLHAGSFFEAGIRGPHNDPAVDADLVVDATPLPESPAGNESTTAFEHVLPLRMPEPVNAIQPLTPQQLQWLQRWWGWITQFTGSSRQQYHYLAVLTWQANAIFGGVSPALIAAATSIPTSAYAPSWNLMLANRKYARNGDVPKFAMQMQICERIGHRSEARLGSKRLKSAELAMVLKAIMDHHTSGNGASSRNYFTSPAFAEAFTLGANKVLSLPRLEPLTAKLEMLSFIRRPGNTSWHSDPNRFDPLHYQLGERPAELPA